MGNRYIIDVKCHQCDTVDEDIYYAPTCDFVTHKCSGCGACIDLVEYTGISYKEASNVDLIKTMINELPRGDRVEIAKSAFGMWANRADLDDTDEKCLHVFEPLDGGVSCTYCDYKPSPEIVAVSMNAFDHIKRALKKWPKTALVQFMD